MDALHHHITQWDFEVDVETTLNSGMVEWFRMSLENHFKMVLVARQHF